MDLTIFWAWGRMRIMSAHLPHAGRSDVECEIPLEMIRNALPTCRKPWKVVIVVDANAEVGQRTAADNADCLGQFKLGERSTRGNQFLSQVEAFNLTIANTYLFQEETGRHLDSKDVEHRKHKTN